jgi:hypothetical protein
MQTFIALSGVFCLLSSVRVRSVASDGAVAHSLSQQLAAAED